MRSTISRTRSSITASCCSSSGCTSAKDEQLARFKEREKSAYKHWKLTDEDWRNREQWDAYELYGHDVVQYTSTQKAPWILVEGNDKLHTRLKVIKTVIDHLKDRVNGT